MIRTIHIIKNYSNHHDGEAYCDTYCGAATKWDPNQSLGEPGWANAATVYNYCQRIGAAICPDCESSPDFALKLLGALP